MTDAPHLPKNTITDTQKQQWRRLQWFFIALGFTLFVSFVVSMVVSSWVMPQHQIQQTTVFTVDKPVIVDSYDSLLSPLVLSQSQQRIVSVYNRQGKVQDLYRHDAFIGNALLLSAGGWAVFYAPESKVTVGNMELVDYAGVSYRVRAMQEDPSIPGLTYIQIEGDNFRGDSQFMDWSALKEGALLVSVNDQVHVSPLAIQSIDTVVPHTSQYRLTDMSYLYTLIGEASIGDIVLNETGAFAGFVTEQAKLIPGWYVEAQVTALLADRRIVDDRIINQGFLVRNAAGNHPGFYIATGSRTGTSSTLAIGDVVVKIDDAFLDELDIAEHVILNDAAIQMEVLRDGEQLPLQIIKE